MTLTELDEYFDSFLQRDSYSADPSRNGIQIQNQQPYSKQIKTVAFATDACEATGQEAARLGADVLFVHHGILWGSCERITQNFYLRIKAFIENDLALYASHIPLDANPLVGNNYGLARRLNLQNLKPFGQWHGMTIGVGGTLTQTLSPEQLAENLFPDGEKANRIFSFGKTKINTVAIISGGAAEDVTQAYEQGFDAYITGEVLHQDFHVIKELGITVIAGGHYQTETIGVKQVMEKMQKETDIKGVFIDIPTGL